MDPLNYPLEQLMTIKKKRYDGAVKILEEKKALLAKEEEKLKVLESERNEVLKHKTDKLTKLRKEMDTGTTSGKIQEMKRYLKVVEEKLIAKQKKVTEQGKNVSFATKQVEIAKTDLFQKQKDVEKLQIHKKEWEKEVRYFANQKEGVEQDELGSMGTTRLNKETKKQKEHQ